MGALTCRKIAERARVVEYADLATPLILSSGGGSMDGMHRVAKALMGGIPPIDADRLTVDPNSDEIGDDPLPLPYGDGGCT